MIAGAVLLAGCDMQVQQRQEEQPPAADRPAPAIWEFASDDGTLEGWLFGTIHVLPDGVEWETPILSDILERSELLVVEVADLDEEKKLNRIFTDLASTAGLPPLDARVHRSRRAALRALMEKGGYSGDDFSATETWAAALTLAQIDRVGDPGNGVDRVLLGHFPDRDVVELEGAVKQLGIFDRLPEKEQRDLLTAIVDEASDPDAMDPAEPAQIWLRGDMDAIMEADEGSLLADAELRSALLDQRNRDWIPRIMTLAERNGPLMVATGAAHMGGELGLPSLLEREGFVVRRVQ